MRNEIKNPDVINPNDSIVWKGRMLRLRLLQDSVQKHLGTAYIGQAHYYNEGRKNIQFKIGDRVIKKDRKLSQATQNYMTKLGLRFVGPFTITRVTSPVMYRLTADDEKIIDKCHINEFKPYHLDDTLQEEQRRDEEERREKPMTSLSS